MSVIANVLHRGTLAAIVGSSLFERGQQVFASGRVEKVIADGGELEGTVRSDGAPYIVRISMREEGLAELACVVKTTACPSEPGAPRKLSGPSWQVAKTDDACFARVETTFLGTFSAIDLYLAAMTRWTPGRDWFAQHAPKLHAIGAALDKDPRLAGLWAANF